MLTGALLLFLALQTFDRNDIASNTAVPNDPVKNAIGYAGAHVANISLKGTGFAAHMIPFLMMVRPQILGFIYSSAKKIGFWIIPG